MPHSARTLSSPRSEKRAKRMAHLIARRRHRQLPDSCRINVAASDRYVRLDSLRLAVRDVVDAEIAARTTAPVSTADSPSSRQHEIKFASLVDPLATMLAGQVGDRCTRDGGGATTPAVVERREGSVAATRSTSCARA